MMVQIEWIVDVGTADDSAYGNHQYMIV